MLNLIIGSVTRWFAFLFLLPSIAFGLDLFNHTSNPKVMILQIVEHPSLNASRQGIIDELKIAGITPSFENAQGNPALAYQIAQKFAGNNPDILIGLGTTASQALLSENRAQRVPIVFSSVTDPVAAGLVNNLKRPEGFVTGVSNYVEVGKQLKMFKALLPTLVNLGIIYNPGEVNSATLLEETKARAREDEITLVTAAANNALEVGPATRQLIRQVNAVFINNDNTALSSFEAIRKVTDQYNIPVFVSDLDIVKQGAFTAMGPDQYMLGRQTGKMVLKILQGEKIIDLPVEFPEKTQVMVNMDQAKKFGISIPTNMQAQIVEWKAP